MVTVAVRVRAMVLSLLATTKSQWAPASAGGQISESRLAVAPGTTLQRTSQKATQAAHIS